MLAYTAHMGGMDNLLGRVALGDSDAVETLVLDGMNDCWSDEDVAALAVAIADSGDQFPMQPESTIDFASTGGPGSLTTLLCPLMLRAIGFEVACLGVQGRPAGAIDVLGTIPGFRVEMSRADALECLRAYGHCHLLAGDAFAPMDMRLFVERQRLGAQAVPQFVIASLLSKKLAMGLRRGIVEVRVGPFGNFGTNLGEATSNAKQLIKVGRLLEVNVAVCLQPDPRIQQPWIGRGEALVALSEIVRGRVEGSLGLHVRYCWDLVCAISGQSGGRTDCSVLEKLLDEQLRAQSSSMRAFDTRVAETKAADTRPVLVGSSGFVSLDARRLRETILQFQADSGDRFPDGAGVRLAVPDGAQVHSGDVVCHARASQTLIESFAAALSEGFHVRPARLATPVAWTEVQL